MYLQFSLHVSRIPCQLTNSLYLQSINRLHRTTKRLQLAKTRISIHAVSDKKEQIIPEKEILRVDLNTSSQYDLKYHLYNFNDKKDNLSKQNITWREAKIDVTKLGHYYLKLSKFRLTSLVVVTSMIGYAMSPNPFQLTSFISSSAGTALVSSAANSINQFLEIPFDAQMSRTRNRVLVKGHLSPLHALGFATITGSLGLFILYQGANALTAALGTSNLVLYTMVYTPLKRISIANTWIGSVVGAIPPLMGWAACQGSVNAGALILAGILFAWQFPHFNALSWNLRPDYSRAGYRMMAVTNPGLCRRTALRYTVGIAACSSLAPIFGLTHWSFGLMSLPVNVYFTYLGYKFFKESDSKNSRALFRFSLLHLPLLLGLMLLTKQDLFISTSSAVEVKNRETAPSYMEEGEISKRRLYDASNKIKQNSGFSNISLGPTLHAQIK